MYTVASTFVRIPMTIPIITTVELESSSDERAPTLCVDVVGVVDVVVGVVVVVDVVATQYAIGNPTFRKPVPVRADGVPIDG